MLRPMKKLSLWLLPASIFIIPALVLAQVYVATNIDDIKGAKSKVVMAQGSRNVHHSQRTFFREASIRTEREGNYRRRNRERVARLENQIKTVRALVASRRAGATKRPILTAQTVVEVPYQNLTLSFVTPKQAPIAGLHVVATVHPKTGQDTILNSLITDSKGHVRLAKVGPLPVSIEMAVASTPISGSEEPEWRLSDVRTASLVIPHGLGPRVATYAGLPYQVASLHPVFSNRRAILYQYQQPSPVVVERRVADVDITAPVGSTVTTPALGDQQITVPGEGHVVCRLPVSALNNGLVPIRVASNLPAGEAEAVITAYTHDPYQPNLVTSPDLQLVRINNVAVRGNIGVMDKREQIISTFGDARKRRDSANVVKLNDGSEVWNYPQQGTAYKMRSSPFKEGRDYPSVVERVRLSGSRGGSIGGITVGSRTDDVARSFGKPESETTNYGEPGKTENYLDQGVRICEAAGRVQWIEIARPNELLVGGTTAFVPRGAARLFIEDYHGDSRAVISGPDELRAYLAKLPSVRLVSSKADADLVLKASVTDFQGHKDQVIDGLPFKYSCTTKLAYSLYDPNTSQYVVSDKRVEASAGADYTTEALVGAGIGGFLLTRKSDIAKIFGALIVGGGVLELNKSVQRAANRCPGIAARTVFNDMVQDINRVSDFSVRMTGIDYGTGRMRFNVGTASGIHVSTQEDPCEFEVMIGGKPLPDNEGGNSADYYTAVVVDADEQSCQCELHHVRRKVNRSSESTSDDPDPDMVRRIPEPATGVVSARASVHFASLPVITDADVEAANQQAAREAEARDAEAQKQQQENQQQNQNNSNSDAPPADPLGSLFDKVFGRKKK